MGGPASSAPAGAHASAPVPPPPPAAAAATGDYDKQWLEHWQEGVDPGQLWDAGCCSPMLTHLLDSGQLEVRGRRTLVPGCGRGYDVAAFASAGAAASVGLDLSADAVAAARAECARLLAAQPAAAAACELAAGDFFAYAHPSGAPFDVGYDYTFLCALHPDMRQSWAAAWARLIAPGGELVTLMFPVGGAPPHAPRRDPPWAVTPELYGSLLTAAGFEAVTVEQVPPELSHQPRAGREWLGRWRRLGGAAGGAGSGGSAPSPAL